MKSRVPPPPAACQPCWLFAYETPSCPRLPATIRIGIATKILKKVVSRLRFRSGYSTENRTGYAASPAV